MTDAHDLTLALGGRWYRRRGAAPCSVCQPERRKGQNALSLADGDKGLVLHCWKSGCSFRDILAAAGVTSGTYQAPDPAELARRRAEAKAEAERKARQALDVWREAQSITGTCAETYLRGCGITCALPDTLRFHPECWHGATAQRLPALVARVEGAEGFAVHRTYLRADGTGKADVEPAKAMLGGVQGGAVRLSEGPGPLVVAEGIETALSLPCGLLRAPVTTWAALSASGLRALRLPPMPGEIIVAMDNDATGLGAGQDLAARAYRQGWKVSTLTPPEGANDWNDFLRGGAA